MSLFICGGCLIFKGDFHLSSPVMHMNNMCKMSTDLQQQSLKGQAGIPAGQAGVAECVGRGQAQLEHPAVTL